MVKYSKDQSDQTTNNSSLMSTQSTQNNNNFKFKVKRSAVMKTEAIANFKKGNHNKNSFIFSAADNEQIDA